MQQFLEWMYIVCLALLSLFLAKRSSSPHKFILFLIVCWLWALTSPAIDNLIIPVTKGFEIQPSRLLLFIFLPYILLQSITGRKPRLLIESSYEKFLIAFYFTGLIGLIYHLGNAIEFRDAVVTYTGWLTFSALYMTLRQNADEEMIINIFRTFIFIAILSSIVAIIQFMVFPDFLRYTFKREAYKGYLRSNGLFRDDYIHSYFCILASYITLLFVKNRLSKIFILVTLAIGIAFSFHRMSWIIFLFTFGLWFYYFTKMQTVSKILGILIIILSIISVNTWMETHTKSESFKDRLMADTVTERVSFFDVAIQRISKEWIFGVGSVHTKAYYQDAVVSGHEYAASGEAGGIHNLYLFLAYFYGIPVALSFTGFLFATALFFWKCFRIRHMFYLLPTLTMMMFILANLTNYFPPHTDLSVYIAIIMGLSISVLKNGLESKISL